jgi:hypothetical protein
MFRFPLAAASLALSVSFAQFPVAPASAAEPGIVTCFVTVERIVALPAAGANAIVVDSWNTEPLNVRATIYSAAHSYRLDLRDVAFEPRAKTDDDRAPYRTRPVYFMLPSNEAVTAASLDFQPAGSACLTRGYAVPAAAAANATPSAEDRSIVDRFEQKSPLLLNAVDARVVAPLRCSEPYRPARNAGPRHFTSSMSVPPENGFVDMLVGLTAKGDVSSVGLLDSNVTRPFEGAALNEARHHQFEAEVFRCAPVAGGYLYHFDFHHDGFRRQPFHHGRA